MTAYATMQNRAERKGLSIQEADDITLRNRKESPFLRLPGEIRNKIYNYTFGGHIIHVLRDDSKYLLYRTIDSQPAGYSLSALNNMTTLCRQIRSETALLPLERNEFKLLPYSLSNALPTLKPPQLSAIRAVRIPFLCWGLFDSGFLGEPLSDWKALTRLSRVTMKMTHLDGDDVRIKSWQIGIRETFREAFGRVIDVSFE